MIKDYKREMVHMIETIKDPEERLYHAGTQIYQSIWIDSLAVPLITGISVTVQEYANMVKIHNIILLSDKRTPLTATRYLSNAIAARDINEQLAEINNIV